MTTKLSNFDKHLFSQGKHWHAYRFLGAHCNDDGVLFAVWAPNAEAVSVVGDFNNWDGRVHPMQIYEDNGIWELFISDIKPGALYKFEIRNRHGHIFLKSDPYGQQFELRPNTASIVTANSDYKWHDDTWLKKRQQVDWQHIPMSIYEVHLGAWQKTEDGEFLNYREIAKRLVKYVVDMGFTHIELLPITEHPFDGSWGYQCTGYYAPTSRYGTPDDFRYFVDYCHQNNIGIILDWVPAHFPKDAYGLARFDGTALYEHEDPRQGEHLDWQTLIYNYGRFEVKNFLFSSALYWIEEFHLDGLRVDAVASMLYLDYSREEWIPNEYGGRENLEAIGFLRQLTNILQQQNPGVLMIAEESTSWPQVTGPSEFGGLGFNLKWNMGWMNDTLRYISRDSIHRKHHQNDLTFSMLYAFSENFLLPFSHDEVVHGKGSMLSKMPGDEWQRFANLRLLYSYMFTHPGKKLLFMGTEFAQSAEWNEAVSLDWYLLQYDFHQGVQTLVKDLNHIYQQSKALYKYEFEQQGFYWIDCNDNENSVLIFARQAEEESLIIVLNFTPVPRHYYRIGVPRLATYKEIFNSDATIYGGSNVNNNDRLLKAENIACMNQQYSISISLPPLGALILK
jgi:1,4-alpha-glucan branching enzyme